MKIETNIPCQVYRICRANPDQIEEMMNGTESLHLTETDLCSRSLSLIKAFVAGGGELILDANQVAAFFNQEAIDYAEVLKSHLGLVKQLPTVENVRVVAPYVENRLEKTIVLQRKHQPELKQLAELGVTFILPMSFSSAAPKVLQHLNWFKKEIGKTIMGLKPGLGQKDLMQVLEKSGCKRIHLLNAMSRPAKTLLDQMPTTLQRIPKVSGSFQPQGQKLVG